MLIGSRVVTLVTVPLLIASEFDGDYVSEQQLELY
jgi:hypothetical protein